VTPAAVSLFEVQQRIKQTLEAALASSFWITAEINEIKSYPTGHCYLTLVEKDDDSESLKAKAAATIWERTFRLLKAYFESSTGQSLTAGLKIMVKASVQYHPLYGLNLNITDIEPAYTVGSMALQRRNTIARLEADGVFDMNRELPFPELPQRIAVISSEQAAGYQDFVQHLDGNDYGYRFVWTLFPSLMQGEKAAQHIIGALDRINARSGMFDAVVIIRGGGAVADLACFDDYALSAHVAQFPLPVLTGIGHNKDESVVDLVAHQALKTPTAVADFLIGCLLEEETALDEYRNVLEYILHTTVAYEINALNLLHQQLSLAAEQKFQQEDFSLQLLANDIESYNPYNIMARGYALASFRGRPLTNAAAVHAGDKIDVMLHKGAIRAVVCS
jgi:exodeoxyribonuclease VII large subunit